MLPLQGRENQAQSLPPRAQGSQQAGGFRLPAFEGFRGGEEWSPRAPCCLLALIAGPSRELLGLSVCAC